MTDAFDDLEALAADYVLGVLDDAGRRRAEALLASDPGFARLVGLWSERLASLTEAVAPVEPPSRIWRDIQAEIGASSAPTVARARRLTLLQRVGFWRWCTVGTGALAAALAIYLAAVPPGPPPKPEGRLVAVLNGDAASPAWLVTVDLGARELTIRPLGLPPAEDKSHELWLVAGTSAAPRSLGLLDSRNAVTLPLAAALAADAAPGAALAVSLESKGGSPTGLPTGPVLYQGALLPLNR